MGNCAEQIRIVRKDFLTSIAMVLLYLLFYYFIRHVWLVYLLIRSAKFVNFSLWPC